MSLIEEAKAFRKQIDNVSATVDDSIALENKDVFPLWQAQKEYYKDNRVRYNDLLYKCRQGHLSVYPPSEVPALWEVIDIEHEGTLTDPIPYNVGMEIFKDKYYLENDIVYLCIRDSQQPLHNNLKDLVGNYVEVVNNE